VHDENLAKVGISCISSGLPKAKL